MLATESKNLATIPHSFLIVIDDVGWWCGKDQRYKNGPSRSGLEQRRHVIEDYRSIVALGKSLNMRIKCGFVIGEWDRTNLLAGVRNSNKYGTQWDQASRLDPLIDEARDLINASGDYLELAVHGLVHMYWNDLGKMQHAEFYQKAPDGNGYIKTPSDIVREHLDAYFAIYQQNGFTAELTSFIPPCFQYVYSPERDQLSAILSEYGIRHVSTPYASMGYTSEEKPVDVSVENGIITVDRTTDLTSWDVVGATPPGVIKKSFYGLHWVNIINNDVAKNSETVQTWIRYFAQYKHRFDLLVARDNAVASAQALYKKYTKVVVGNDQIVLDFAAVDKQAASALVPTVYLNVVNEKVPWPDQTVDLRVSEVNDQFTTYQVTRRMPGSGTGKTVLMLSDRRDTNCLSVVNP